MGEGGRAHANRSILNFGREIFFRGWPHRRTHCRGRLIGADAPIHERRCGEVV